MYVKILSLPCNKNSKNSNLHVFSVAQLDLTFRDEGRDSKFEVSVGTRHTYMYPAYLE